MSAVDTRGPLAKLLAATGHTAELAPIPMPKRIDVMPVDVSTRADLLARAEVQVQLDMDAQRAIQERRTRTRYGLVHKAMNLRRAFANNPASSDGYYLKRHMADYGITEADVDAHEADVDAKGAKHGLYVIAKRVSA